MLLRHRLLAVALTSVAAACGPATVQTTSVPAPAPAAPAGSGASLAAREPLASLDAHRVVPRPLSVRVDMGAAFTLDSSTVIVVAGGGDVPRLGDLLATMLRPATGMPFTVTTAAPARNAITLALGAADSLGDEGYELTIADGGVRLSAARAPGLFRGIQTLRQLLPAGIEMEQSVTGAARAWTLPAGRIVDRPRYAWRGAMLDVARHFFTVDEVKQYLDLMAMYKLNTFHIHLSDDQGWRIQIDSRPRLTTVGGASEVGGGPGGFYTKADYAEIVRYAAERFITVIPEIDMPAHTAAAIAAYPEIGCSRPRPYPSPNAPSAAYYTGIRVGWSALCHDKPETWAFIDDVIRELAAMTPGAYLHIGGDEVEILNHEQYVAFVERVEQVVEKYGKQVVGWEEITQARLRPNTVAQQWRSDSAGAAVRAGAKLLVSPAAKAYIDMQYTTATELGLHWAAYIELRGAYDWDPATYVKGAPASSVVGIEAPLWAETIQNITAAMYLAVPRLPALAEVGWTPQGARGWDDFARRIAHHAPRWRLLGINYYPSPQVSW